MLIPELRFQEFNESWSKIKLGEHIEVKMCKRIFAEQTSENEDIPFYKIGTLGKEADKFISRKLFCEYKTKYNYPLIGQVLITCSGTVGNCIQFDGTDSYFQDSNIVWLNHNEKIILDVFLIRLLRSFNWNILNTTTIARIYSSDLRSLRFTIPSLPEQQKIADFLTAVDRKIQALTRKVDLLKDYKKGVMQKILPPYLARKEPYFRLSNDSNWNEYKLSELLITRSETSENDLPKYSLTIEDGITPKGVRYEREFLVKDTSKAYKVMKLNDFALNPMNLRFGAIAKHNETFDVFVSKYYDIFYCNTSLHPIYAISFFQSYNMIQFYNKMATGSLIEKKRVHYSDFLNFKFLFPSYKEQTKIANFLSSIDQKINAVENQLDKTKEWKKGLLQKMFV